MLKAEHFLPDWFSMIDININKDKFLACFEHIYTDKLDVHGKTKLDLFMLNVNSNDFNYPLLIERLRTPVIEFALSSKRRTEFKDDPGNASSIARNKFRDFTKNKGELGELLLFCFLEAHLGAPKILSKMDLKTTSGLHYNGSDGVHLLKLEEGKYQLIFGESKTYISLYDAIKDAFSSINEFKKEQKIDGTHKTGINFEKSLIDGNLYKEFEKEDADFIKDIIYPTKHPKTAQLDDAFGIFIGFEVPITVEDKKLPNDKFRYKIKSFIESKMREKHKLIVDCISKYDLWGHNFYIYLLPFSQIDNTRKDITKKLTE